MSLEKAVLGSLLLTLASTTSFFPPSLTLDLSEKALERSVGVARHDAGVYEGAQLRKQFEWALLGLKEQPLWSRGGARRCRMLAMLHRSFLVLRVDEATQGNGQLVAKRYDQGSSPEGVALSATKKI